MLLRALKSVWVRTVWTEVNGIQTTLMDASPFPERPAGWETVPGKVQVVLLEKDDRLQYGKIVKGESPHEQLAAMYPDCFILEDGSSD